MTTTMTMSAVEYLNIYYDFYIFIDKLDFEKSSIFYFYFKTQFLAWAQRKVPAMQ